MRIVYAGFALILFLLLGTVAWTAATSRSTGLPQQPSLTIEVIGHQWWWEVRYLSEDPSRFFTTANEIHIPIGKTVEIHLASADVIHSFWIPSLGGKTDLIPGMKNVTWFEASKPGVYRGQCAEFCGLQHANMALLVVATEPEAFAAWWDSQLQGAPSPRTEMARLGETAFIQKCGVCHAVRGTRAGGILGPNLSHLMQRRTIAAGTLPNTPGHLAGWIADPQAKKPGNLMPRPEISGRELQSILTFLQTLR